MSIKLGNICSFQSGGTPAKGKPEYFNGTIPWITTTALNGSNINENDAIDWITERAIEETAAKIVPAYSIMVC
ncbi:MAG: restriction endonuclease subunit S [Eubacteriales bacterium]|nr:restriction endonuclease subunit S [Eubacteriales bacterium]